MRIITSECVSMVSKNRIGELERIIYYLREKGYDAHLEVTFNLDNIPLNVDIREERIFIGRPGR